MPAKQIANIQALRSSIRRKSTGKPTRTKRNREGAYQLYGDTAPEGHRHGRYVFRLEIQIPDLGRTWLADAETDVISRTRPRHGSDKRLEAMDILAVDADDPIAGLYAGISGGAAPVNSGNHSGTFSGGNGRNMHRSSRILANVVHPDGAIENRSGGKQDGHQPTHLMPNRSVRGSAGTFRRSCVGPSFQRAGARSFGRELSPGWHRSFVAIIVRPL